MLLKLLQHFKIFTDKKKNIVNCFFQNIFEYIFDGKLTTSEKQKLYALELS